MKRIPAITRVMGVATLTLLLSAVGCKRETASDTQTTSGEMATAQKISKIEQEINSRQQEVNELLRQYVQQGGTDLGAVTGQGLTPDQVSVLERKLKSEEGVAYRDLLADVAAAQKSVDDLKVAVQNLEKTLPAPIEVTRGERHYDIAMNYLTKERGLDPVTAQELVQKVNLTDELVPGFKVWNFYHDGTYGSFVTQGSANVSPYGAIQNAKKVLVNARDAAIAEKDALARERAQLREDVSNLRIERAQLDQELAILRTEKDDLTNRVQKLQALSANLESRMNSVFYRIDSRKILQDEGSVHAPWYAKASLVKFNESDYPSRLDLRSANTISFTAKEAHVDSIRRVKVAPAAVFREGTDYTVTITLDRQSATVHVLNKDKFRASRSMMVLVN